MACLLFLLAKFSGRWDSPYDTFLFLCLLSWEGPGYLNTVRLWRMRR